MGSDRLERYRDKRSFDRTPEPSGDAAAPAGAEPTFVVHKHAARRLHYDFRLEADGVLVSWAVPKGPSYDPRTKRLAVHVEDHPLDYRTFEGVIPNAQYGAGSVIVWDRGTYRQLGDGSLADAVAKGHVSVWLEGTKLRGGWSLTRTRGDDQWLLIKRSDETADPDLDITAAEPDSVATGRSLDAVGADEGAAQWTRGRATWTPPMLAQLVKAEDHLRAAGRGPWSYERKLDGLRCEAVRNGGEVELWSRNHLPFNDRFPDLVAALAAVPADNFTIDGEIVAFEGDRSTFGGLHRRGEGTRVVFAAFDLLHLLGRDTTGLDTRARRDLLRQVLDGADERITVVSGEDGDPVELFERACRAGWEGLVAKRQDAPYRGGRSGDWLKLKCLASQELVVVGWTEPQGSRSGFGALLTATYDEDGQLRYAGKVGTGFDHRTLVELHGRLAALEVDRSPLGERVPGRGIHWVRPELVAAVAFTEWTGDGHLRHPSFQGLRPDKDPRQVRREVPA